MFLYVRHVTSSHDITSHYLLTLQSVPITPHDVQLQLAQEICFMSSVGMKQVLLPVSESHVICTLLMMSVGAHCERTSLRLNILTAD